MYNVHMAISRRGTGVLNVFLLDFGTTTLVGWLVGWMFQVLMGVILRKTLGET